MHDVLKWPMALLRMLGPFWMIYPGTAARNVRTLNLKGGIYLSTKPRKTSYITKI